MKDDQSLLLGIESSGTTCAAALARGATILAEFSLSVPNQHDRFLAEFCRRILLDCDKTIEDVHAVAVSAGPGSFTGLRIGAGLAKALCYENAPALVPVPTLHALAWGTRDVARATGCHGIVALVPSHKNLLYVQEFSADGESGSSIELVEREQFEAQRNAETMYCGPALDRPGPGVVIPALNRLNIRSIAGLGLEFFKAGKTIAAAGFTPLYAQEFVPGISNKL